MKKILLLVFLFLAVLSACDKDDPVAEQLKTDIALIEEYLSANNITAQSTESGLYYVIQNEGTGARPTIYSTVRVEYTGKLLNGIEFDSGISAFPLSGVIKGWQQGIPLFKEGGQGILFIPSGLGYGSTVKPNIPANSVLIFDIRLIDVSK